MAIGITVAKQDLGMLYVDVTLTGLTIGTKYDVHRLQMRYLGDDDLGDPVYERELPDRRALWSAVAHRVGWTATATTHTFRDYECPTRPTKWFLVPTSSVSPYEFTFGLSAYPLSRGVLSADVVHFSRDLELALEAGTVERGGIIVRSTTELGLFSSACVVDMEELRYTAFGAEHHILKRQYPVFVADTREARRGTLVLKTDDLGQYNDLRRIVFPSDGRIKPIIFNSGGDATMLLDDMRVLPLDVRIEQATQNNPDIRFVSIDWIETDPTEALIRRSGDNDALVSPPHASFSISDSTPARNQWITLTDHSTGQFDSWEWTFGRPTNNKVNKYYTKGPHKVHWLAKGKVYVKLRVYGSIDTPNGSSTITKTYTVH